MLLLFVMGMLLVLEELVVFVGGMFENVITPTKICEKFIESKKEILDTKKNQKILKTESKIHLYFRVLHSSIPLAKMTWT